MASKQRGLMAAGALVLGLVASGGAAQVIEPYEPDAEAVELLEQLLEASRQRTAVTTKSTLEIELVQGETSSKAPKRTATFVFAKGGDGILQVNDFTCHLNDDTIFAVHDRTDHSYYREEFEGSPYYYIFSSFQALPFPHLALLWGEPLTSDVCMQLHPDTPWIVPTSVSKVEAGDADAPEELTRLELSSPNGALRLDIDEATMLVRAMEHEVTGGHAIQPGVRKVTRYELEHTVHESAPAEIRFEVGERQRVDMVASLMPPPEPADGPGGGAGGAGDEGLVGRPAPPFVLATADGDAVDLLELRGKVVVIDFWATWCPPCVKALPLLHEVADWVRTEELPVTVLTVNVWEIANPQENDPDARLEKVKAFWEKKGFSLPVAMDYSDDTATAYGLTGIPATFVIRSDGVVHAQHAGAGAEYAEILRNDIRGALEALEDPAEPEEHAH
jgi:thiol-disulfide isomerase/thioredoxin